MSMSRSGDGSDRLVGRAGELAQLEAVCRAAAGGRGRVVFISGAMGSGRTLLADTFLRTVVQGSPEAVVASACCVEGLSPHRPFGAFRDLAAQLAGAGTAEDVRSLLREHAPAWVAEEGRASSRADLLDQYVEACDAIAGRNPTVLFVDDMQWCDRSSIDLLCTLGKTVARFPLVLLIATDTGRAGGSLVRDVQGRIGVSATIELPVLDLQPPEVEALLRRQLDGRPSDSLVDWVVRTTRGNPFHITELVQALVERRAIRRRLLKYSLRSDDIPGALGGLEGAVASRIGSLDPELRWTLEAAACVGAEVEPAVLGALLEMEGGRLREQLRTVVSAGFLEPVEPPLPGGREGFRFRHPLHRNVLRGNVGGTRRARLARRAAEEMGRATGDGGEDRSDRIAALHLDAGVSAEAHPWLLRAADLAERLFAHAELEAFLEPAVRSAPDPGARAAVEDRLAQVYMATGRESEAEELLAGVVERSREHEEPAAETVAATRLAWMQMERGAEPAELAALAGRLVDSAREAAGERELVDALDFASAVAERLGRAEEALLMAEEAFHIAKGAEVPPLVARAARRLACVHISFEDPARGGELVQQALEIESAGDAGDSSEEAMAECRHLLGRVEFRRGDWRSAAEHWDAALATPGSASERPRRQRVEIEIDAGLLAGLRGDFESGRERLKRAMALARAIGDDWLGLLCESAAARLEFERGDHAAVLAETEAIREAMPELGNWHVDFQTTTLRALAHLELGDELPAWQEAARLEQLYQGKEGWFVGRPEGDAVRIRVIDMDADPGLASMIAEHGLRETAGKDAYGEAFLRYHLASVLARTHPQEALNAAVRSRELLEALGAAPLLERLTRLLEELPDPETAPSESVDGGEDVTDEAIDRWFDGL